MKHKSILFFLIFNLILIPSTSISSNTKIVVKIENELITTYDIKNKIISTLLLNNKQINQKNIDNLKKGSLETLIQNRLKKIELQKYNIKSDNLKIASYLNSLSSNNITNLRNTFEQNNLDFQTFKDEVDIEFKWRNFIFEKFSNKIEIDSNNIINEIETKINKQNLINYNLSEIEILKTSPEQDKKKVLEIQNFIKQAGFEKAVRKYSIGSTADKDGQLGWVKSNSLSKDFLNILRKTKIKEITQPILQQNRITIIKLNDKRIEKITKEKIESLKNELIAEKNDLFKLYSNSYLSKLRNTKLIEYIDVNNKKF